MKLSIIVPVYKVEQYLDKCVESILAQTFTDYEIILVDDGSPDNCGQMCREWERRDGRIRTIHKENGGLSDARNAGIDIAKGDYIGFVDSDDYIKPDMFEVLVANLERNNADISMCGYMDVYANGVRKKTLIERCMYGIKTRLSIRLCLGNCCQCTQWSRFISGSYLTVSVIRREKSVRMHM